MITNPDPSIPTVVVTPCPSRPREVACLVPYQDSAVGNRLFVPTHPALNDAHPPLVEHWRYEDGHWRAQLLPVQEQMSEGMFSRPLSTRRQRARDVAATQEPSSRGRFPVHRESLNLTVPVRTKLRDSGYVLLVQTSSQDPLGTGRALEEGFCQ